MSDYSEVDIPIVPRLKSSCKGMPVEWWFPEHPPTSEQSFNAARAVEVCKTCVDIEACGEFAIQNPRVIGIWGGMSWKQRQRIRVVRERNAAFSRIEEEKQKQRSIASELKVRQAQ